MQVFGADRAGLGRRLWIALAVGGKLERNLTPEQLKGRLEELLNISPSNEKTAIA